MNMTSDALAVVHRASFIAVFLFFSAHFGFARDAGFIPGDAFFQCLITADSCGEIQEDDSIILREYNLHGISGMNAYLGFQRIRVASNGKALQAQLQDACAKLSQTRIRPEQKEGAILLIYNADFDPSETPLGLRFNERWISNREDSLTYPRGYYHIEWEGSEEAVFYDLSQAPSMDRLCVEYSQTEKDATKEHDEPYTVQANYQDLKFVLIEKDFFEKMDFVRYATILMQMGEEVEDSGPTSVVENGAVERSEGDSEKMLSDAELVRMFRERFDLASTIELKTFNCRWIEICHGESILVFTGISKVRRRPLSEVGNGFNKP